MYWIRIFMFSGVRHAFKKAIRLMSISKKQLSYRTMILDFWSVLKSVGFVALSAMIAGLIFLLLGQGKDTMLLVIERMMEGNWWALIGLTVALAIWSIFSELSVRYAIAVSDNSGLNLVNARVLWRATVQKLLAALFLLWPGMLVVISFVWTISTTEYIDFSDQLFYGGMATIIIIFVLAVLSELYFNKFGRGVAGHPKSTIFGSRSLPTTEQHWLGKLYGIYNDYVFILPKPTNFRSPNRAVALAFSDIFTDNNLPVPSFPQDKSKLSSASIVPAEFVLLNPTGIKNTPAHYKWIYRIPPGFYKEFHWQVKRMAIISLLIIVAMALVPAGSSFYAEVGAPALVCMAFGCYSGIYCGLLYLDKAVLNKFTISIRLLLFLWVILVSYINNDHPIENEKEPPSRVEVQTRFKDWFAAYKKRFDSLSADSTEKYPVIFICAEGGAFRTGAYTSLLLTQMESDLARRLSPVDFRRGVFAMSGVSGGALGLSFYNAVAFRSRTPIIDTFLVRKTRAFFLEDSLSPIIGRMFYGEFLNLFYWRNLEMFDRSVILEKTWEKAYGKFKPESDVNTYQHPFVLTDTGAVKPIFLINTLEVESGLQCVVSNAQPKGMLLEKKRDLMALKLRNIKYSTAVNFSTRFPLFSPAAMLRSNNDKRLHYLDGGYVENTGAATMLEMLQLLKQTPEFKQIVPVVIALRFGTDTTTSSGIRFINEFNEIVSGIINTRAGRTNSAIAQLEKETQTMGGIWIDEPLSPKEKEIPMNWVLSTQSMNRIQDDIHKKLSLDSPLLKKLFKPGVNYMSLKKVKRKNVALRPDAATSKSVAITCTELP